MVRENRIKEEQITLTADAGGFAEGYTRTNLNGEIMAVETTFTTAGTVDLTLMPSGGQVANKRILFVQSSGADVHYPRHKIIEFDGSAPDATGNEYAPIVIRDFIFVSGTNMGNGSALDVNIKYR